MSLATALDALVQEEVGQTTQGGSLRELHDVVDVTRINAITKERLVITRQRGLTDEKDEELADRPRLSDHRELHPEAEHVERLAAHHSNGQ